MTERAPLKRGTPEFRQHMKTIGAKGGRSTQAKYPGHLKEIAAAGGRATRKPKSQRIAPEPGAIVEEVAPIVALDEIANDIDAFFASLDAK